MSSDHVARSGRPALAAAVLALALLAPVALHAAISGHSIVSNCGGEAGNYVTITFTSDEPVTLVDVRWDFTGTIVWYDPSGVSFCPTINDGVASVSVYLVPPGGRTQVFGLACTGFDGGDSYQLGCDLDRGSGGTPFTSDYYGGTVTCEFSDGTTLVGTFDTPYDEPNGARADIHQAMPDLSFADRPGWYAPVVPRADGSATWTSVPAPTVLLGDQTATWLSACCYNGGDATAMPSVMTVEVDGQTACNHNLWTISPGAYNGWACDGPHTVRGGRHTVVAFADAGGVIDESDETNNVHARQWVWEPVTLSSGVGVTRAAPPPQSAGFEHISGGAWYNCDGLRIDLDEVRPWNVVWMVPQTTQPTAYWPRLYGASTGPEDGFGPNLCSTVAATGLDALLLNAGTLADATYDVGVLNASLPAGTADYRISHGGSSPYPFDFGIFPTTPYFVSRVMSFDLAVSAGDLGPASLVAVTDPADGPVELGWLPPSFTCGPLGDVQGTVSTGTRGWAICNLELTQTGHHGVVGWGEPDAHPGSLAVRVGAFRARCDLAPATPQGWWGPIVPRPDPDAVLFGCGLPDTLHGDGPFTYLNTACVNGGSAPADTVSFKLDVDGTWIVGYRSFSALPAGHPRMLMNLENGAENAPWTVPGGRHTLSVETDYFGDVAELLEMNNLAGRQYCWSPAVLGFGEVRTRPEVPAREGGHGHCEYGVELWPNCDGLRLPPPVGKPQSDWRGAAVMPSGSSRDVDLELHAPLVGTLDGFGPDRLAESASGPGEIDFALVSYHVAARTPYDLGVLDGPGNGGHGYTIENLTASVQGAPQNGAHGPFPVPAGRMLSLLEFTLPAGPIAFRVDNEGSPVTWGLSIYRGDVPFHGKDDALPGGLAVSMPGEPAWIQVDVPVPGSYAVAVWKANAGDLAAAASYTLWVTPGATGAAGPDPDVPAITRLVGAAPNPCNPRAVIRYELAAAADCRLDVHDLQGHLVRHLADGPRAAGRHEAVFDGRDDAGRALPSGVYLVRLRAGDVRELRKLTLVR
jgi:hypothetical protein